MSASISCPSGLAFTHKSPSPWLEASIPEEVHAHGRDLSDAVARKQSRGDLEPSSPSRRVALEEVPQSKTQIRLQLQEQMS